MRITLILMLFFVLSCGKDNPPSTTSDTGTDSANNANNSGDDTGADLVADRGADIDSGRDVARDLTVDTGSDMFQFPDVPPQMCTHPTTDPLCPMGEFGPATFLNSVEVVLDNTCCRDLNGDGLIDNRMGSILAGIAGFGVDINVDIANAIQAGALIYLVEFANWENETFDPALDATIYRGTDFDVDFADNLLGQGTFLVLPDSFDANNGDPLFPFGNANVIAGDLTAQGGTIDLRFPGLLDEVKIITTDLTFTGVVDPTSTLESMGGVAITEGTLSGAILRDRFFQSLNEAAVGCTCIGREIFTPNADGSYDCDLTAGESMACEFDPEAGCRLMGANGSCGLWGQFGSTVDVDTDGDDVNDAFSIGLRVSGVQARIAGRAP